MGHALVIAEAGVNHNGDINIAKQLAYEAKEAGADIVKFQTVKLDALVSKYAEMAEYQKKNVKKITSQKEMLQKIILSFDEFAELAEFCKEISIEFLSTPFDLESIDFLQKLGCRFWKIPSGEITNYPYLVKIARTGLPIVLSTGMSTLEDVEMAINLLSKNGSGKITLLHCTTEYPAPYQDVNLKAMLSLREKFNLDVGYSDHTLGSEVAVAAVALGAKVIEKHFTINRAMEGPDHKASLEPYELKKMINEIRNVEKALGDGNKQPTIKEIENAKVARKSIVAKFDIKKGDIFTEKNITAKRPGTGISPMKWEQVIGTKAIRDFNEDELIEI